jgi:hypothetical protein
MFLLNSKNYKNGIENAFYDFRNGQRFISIFEYNLSKYGDLNQIYFNLFIDDTRINQRKIKYIKGSINLIIK